MARASWTPRAALACGVAALLGACAPEIRTPPARAAPRAGDVAGVERLSHWPRWVLRAVFWWQDLSAFAPERGVSLYRVRYWSEGTTGDLEELSGLLAIPDGGAPLRGLASWQHGTITLAAAAPSAPDLFNGVVPAAVFGGAGYVLVAPDYPGFGVSSTPHAYYHTTSIAASVVNLVRAARQILAAQGIEVPPDLYLTGFSQGGHASLAAHRAIEAAPLEDMTLRGSAAIAGPLDLPNDGLANALSGRARFGSLYLAWIAVSYARVYGEPLDSVLRASWTTAAPPLFDGTRDGAEILAALPADPRQLFTDELLAAIDTGGQHWFLERLRENSLLDWRPCAPARSYHGDEDAEVPATDSHRLAARAAAEGFDFEAIGVGPYDHDASVLRAAPLVLAWFDQLGRQPARRCDDGG